MIVDILILLASIGLFVLLSAYFSGSETGFMSLSKLKVEKEATRKDHRAKMMLHMLSKPSRLLGTILVGNNLSNVSATVLTSMLLASYLELPRHWVHILSSFGLTLVMLVFGEVIPKTVFRTHAHHFVHATVPVMRVLHFVFYPVTIVLNGFSHLVLFLLGSRRKEHPHSLSREDIELLVEISVEEGIVDKGAHAFIHSVFQFGQTTVREIMTPLVDVVSTESKRSVNSVVRLIEKSGFSRIPVFEEHAYNLCGYISAFDLVNSRKKDRLRRHFRDALHVPETKRIDSLLVEMRQKKKPIVFVVDEWGGAAGIVTHEDIAEYVVGQIRDMGENVKVEIREENHGEYLVDGPTDVDYLEEKLGIHVRKEGFETVAGFVEYLMQRIPVKGEKVEYDNYEIIIEDAEKTVINKLRFVRKPLRQKGKRHSS